MIEQVRGGYMHNRSRVILPEWIWKEAKDKAHFKELVATYMRRYPGYKVIKIARHYAICEIGR